MPSNISFKQAGVVGVPYTTAALTLKRVAIHKGESVLVLGASGAVGCALVDLARGRGCIVYATTRKEGSGINTTADPQLGALDKLTSGKGVDVVIDTTGQPDLIRAAISKLAYRGRLAMISGKAESEVTISLRDFYREEKTLVGCNSLKCSAEEMAEELKSMTSMFESGELKLPSVENWT
jgi:NADPH:quinone reductase-like Zn-dependent oxidoreductase